MSTAPCGSLHASACVLNWRRVLAIKPYNSRSVSMVIAFLLKHTTATLQEVLEFVEKQRPQAGPNYGTSANSTAYGTLHGSPRSPCAVTFSLPRLHGATHRTGTAAAWYNKHDRKRIQGAFTVDSHGQVGALYRRVRRFAGAARRQHCAGLRGCPGTLSPTVRQGERERARERACATGFESLASTGVLSNSNHNIPVPMQLHISPQTASGSMAPRRAL